MSGEQLTPREAALWNRTRRETLRDLGLDFERYVKTPPTRDHGTAFSSDEQLTPREAALWSLGAATWAHQVVLAALRRLDRLAPYADELPAAPCSIPGVYLASGNLVSIRKSTPDLITSCAIPVLCGWDAGHGGQHSWADIPLPPSPSSGWWPSRWRRR